MIEYRIERPAKLSTVKFLWKLFLKDDPMWHFTLEGTYIEIRVSKVISELQDFLYNKKWKFTCFKYEDNIPITRKYQKQFEHIFHGYSELSMLVPREKNMDWEIGDSEIRQILERCIHLACNIFGLSLGAEARAVSGHGVDRAYMAGKLSAGMESFYEYNKRKGDEEKMAKSRDKSKKETKKKKKVK